MNPVAKQTPGQSAGTLYQGDDLDVRAVAGEFLVDGRDARIGYVKRSDAVCDVTPVIRTRTCVVGPFVVDGELQTVVGSEVDVRVRDWIPHVAVRIGERWAWTSALNVRPCDAARRTHDVSPGTPFVTIGEDVDYRDRFDAAGSLEVIAEVELPLGPVTQRWLWARQGDHQMRILL